MPKFYKSSSHFKRQPKRWPAKKKHDPRHPLRSSYKVDSQGDLQVGDRISPPMTTNIFTLRNSVPDGTLAASTSFVGAAYFFSLSNLDNTTAFLSVFDQYRIDYVEMTFRPMYNFNQNNEAPTIIPLIKTVVDYDDAVAPPNMASLNIFNSVEIHHMEPFTRRFAPHTAIQTIAGSNAAAGYQNLTSPWLDAANPTIPHYGVKVGIQPGTSGAQQNWNLSIMLWVSFRNVR